MVHLKKVILPDLIKLWHILMQQNKVNSGLIILNISLHYLQYYAKFYLKHFYIVYPTDKLLTLYYTIINLKSFLVEAHLR